MTEVQNDRVYVSNNGNMPVPASAAQTDILNQPLRKIAEGNLTVTSPCGMVFEEGETYTISQMVFGAEELQLMVVGINPFGWLELKEKKSFI